jgi:hypothetical protein
MSLNLSFKLLPILALVLGVASIAYALVGYGFIR